MTGMGADATGSLAISLREGRLVVERILLLTGVPAGLAPAVRDAVLTSEALGLGGLRLLRDRFDALKAARPQAARIEREAGRTLLLDAAGEHAWVVAPAVLDLAVARCRSAGLGIVVVTNVEDVAELQVLPAPARRHGVDTVVATNAAPPDLAIDAEEEPALPWRPILAGIGGAAVIIASPPAQPAAETDPVLDRIGRAGLPVEAAFWWELYHLSNRSLTPDSVASRRHAGPMIVEASGRIIGRSDLDDDTDIEMLARGEIGLETPPAAAQRQSNEERGARK